MQLVYECCQSNLTATCTILRLLGQETLHDQNSNQFLIQQGCSGVDLNPPPHPTYPNI